MSREIKFKAWYKGNGDNPAAWIMGFNLINFHDYFTKDLTRKLQRYGQYWEPDEYILVQFTGLKDKNNKEIYEGDIFRQEEEKDTGDITSYHIVTWIPQRAAFYLVDSSHYQILLDNDCEEENEFDWLFEDAALYDFSLDVKAIQLVGNIYDNPDLLKK